VGRKVVVKAGDIHIRGKNDLRKRERKSEIYPPDVYKNWKGVPGSSLKKSALNNSPKYSFGGEDNPVWKHVVWTRIKEQACGIRGQMDLGLCAGTCPATSQVFRRSLGAMHRDCSSTALNCAQDIAELSLTKKSYGQKYLDGVRHSFHWKI